MTNREKMKELLDAGCIDDIVLYIRCQTCDYKLTKRCLRQLCRERIKRWLESEVEDDE